MTASHSSSVMLTSTRSRRMPALFTSTCRSPNASTAVLIEALAALPVGDVVGVGDGLAAHGLDLVDDLLAPAVRSSPDAVDGAAEVVDDDLGALRREQQRVLAADAPAGAGDDRDASVECTHGCGP